MKPTLVLGASMNPERYANKAIFMLKQKGHEVFAVGKQTIYTRFLRPCFRLQ